MRQFAGQGRGRNFDRRDDRRRDNRGGDGRGPVDKRARFMKRARESVSEALRSRDMLLRGVTRTIEDLDQAINVFSERLEDWYGVYFPELKTDDKIKFCDAALIIDRTDLSAEDLTKILGDKRATEIAEKAKTSLGASISKDDLGQCLALARQIKALDKQRSDFSAYQTSLANELAPNVSAIAGADVAAKLISQAGSITKLALMPASTIQVIGAEKALFKHLRNRRIAPPKHGIIFQFAKISASPKSLRGKISRLLANKIALAAKADAFTKKDIRALIRSDFETRFKRIMDEYSKGKKEHAQPGGSEE